MLSCSPLLTPIGDEGSRCGYWIMYNARIVWWNLESYKRYTKCIDTKWYEKERWASKRGLATFTFRSWTIAYCVTCTRGDSNIRAHLLNEKKKKKSWNNTIDGIKNKKRALWISAHAVCPIASFASFQRFGKAWVFQDHDKHLGARLANGQWDRTKRHRLGISGRKPWRDTGGPRRMPLLAFEFYQKKN